MVIARRIGLALALVAGAALATAFLFAPARAEGLAKGSNILALQLAHGDGDFVSPESGGGSISAFDHTEWGGQIQFQRLLSDNWALAFSGGIGTFSETDKYGDNAPPNSPDGKYTQSSWNIRVGADRFVHLSPDFHLFVGPGLEYWSGSAEYDFPAESFVTETGTTTRISLTGRIGAHVGLGSSLALNGYIGGYMGSASADQAGAEASWMPSGNQGAIGLALGF